MTLLQFKEFLVEFRANPLTKKNQQYTEQFIRLINDLQERKLEDSAINRLENELDLLHQNFEIYGHKTQVKKEYHKLLKFLKRELKLTPNYYYTQIGILIGGLAALVFGFFFLFIGMLVGGFLGFYLDNCVQKRGESLRIDWDGHFC
ncbi:DUF456 domain-containing protein [Mesonia sp. HuA40]|uniref:DUF456 domain-containing protein n=1 Tax=Mesonia sp. HuA40 TaxID=2602761 RepID=UPI0011C80EDB|nr:DUF456 domain-containing protein [Mesonia sp. HuA40]TXK70198.1 DUF456 domain-containing protein [Mesonia sp. HuA40]